MEYLRSSMRKSPRQVECCAVLGPESQGETAFSPSRLIIRPGLKCNRNRNADGHKTIEGTSQIRADRLGTFCSEICCAHFGTSIGRTIRTVSFAPEVSRENKSVCIAIPQEGQP